MMETKHPSLEFHCPATQEHISLAFGYLSNEPMMPIFRGFSFVSNLVGYFGRKRLTRLIPGVYT